MGFFFVAVSGNIAAGKSSLLDHIKLEGVEIIRVQEPVAEWIDELAEFYKDPVTHAFPMQVLIVSSRVKVLINAIEQARKLVAEGKKCIIVSERCHWTDMIFAAYLAHTQIMDPKMYHIYRKYIYSIVQHVIPEPHLHIYIRTDSKICQTRILSRGRECEQDMDQETLNGLSLLHDKYFKLQRLSSNDILKIEDLPKTPIEIFNNDKNDPGMDGAKLLAKIITRHFNKAQEEAQEKMDA